MDILDNKNNLQLFSDIGRLPPYYKKFNEKIIGDKIQENKVEDFIEKINNELQYDYIMLFIACSSQPDF
jgi:hypothetical protein